MFGWLSASLRGLPEQTVTVSGIAGGIVGQDFNGDGAVQPRIAGAVDFAHAASADERDNRMAPDESS
jgi:hypothetical protein